MGVLSALLLFPLTGLVHGAIFVLKQLEDEVDTKLHGQRPSAEPLAGLNSGSDSGERLEDESLGEGEEEQEAFFEGWNVIRRPVVKFAAGRGTGLETDDASSAIER